MPRLVLANFYLAPLDHFAKKLVRVPGYVRYMDDFVLFGDDLEALRVVRQQDEAFVGERLRLRLKNAGELDATRRGVGYSSVPRPSWTTWAESGKTSFSSCTNRRDRFSSKSSFMRPAG